MAADGPTSGPVADWLADVELLANGVTPLRLEANTQRVMAYLSHPSRSIPGMTHDSCGILDCETPVRLGSLFCNEHFLIWGG